MKISPIPQLKTSFAYSLHSWARLCVKPDSLFVSNLVQFTRNWCSSLVSFLFSPLFSYRPFDTRCIRVRLPFLDPLLFFNGMTFLSIQKKGKDIIEFLIGGVSLEKTPHISSTQLCI